MGTSKDTYFKMRMTPKEKQELLDDALENHFTNTTLYVDTLIKNARGKKVHIPQVRTENIKQPNIHYHLSRIGNNINQMAYTINKAYLENKLDGELAKNIAEELMYLNIQINNLNKI